MNNFSISFGNKDNSISIQQEPELEIFFEALPYDNRMQAVIYVLCKAISLKIEWGHICSGKNNSVHNIDYEKIDLYTNYAEDECTPNCSLKIPKYLKLELEKKINLFFDKASGLKYDGSNLENIVEYINKQNF